MHIAEGLQRAALTNRNGVAYVDQSARRSWLEMQSAVRSLTGGLASRSVASGDRVVVLASNFARQLGCYAIPSLGAIIVPLNWGSSDREIADAINGGENVFSTEVESAIYAHHSVAECAVIGLRSDRWGELVHAVVVPKEGAVLRASDVIEHHRAHDGGNKCPKSVTIRRDGLPKSGAGKILKTVLREQLASQSDLASAS